MTLSVKHSKTNAITDWTQPQLNQIIAGGAAPLPPAGTTLAQVTLPSDWNAEHTMTAAALSVVGRASNTAGAVADIAASADGQAMRRSGTTVGFGAINLASSNAVTGILGSGNLPTNIAYKNVTNIFTQPQSISANAGLYSSLFQVTDSNPFPTSFNNLVNISGALGAYATINDVGQMIIAGQTSLGFPALITRSLDSYSGADIPVQVWQDANGTTAASMSETGNLIISYLNGITNYQAQGSYGSINQADGSGGWISDNTLTYDTGIQTLYAPNIGITGSIFDPTSPAGPSIYIGGGAAYDASSGLAMNWNARSLFDGGAQSSLDWSNRYLYDTTSNISVNWQARTLGNTSGNSVDWTGSYNSGVPLSFGLNDIYLKAKVGRYNGFLTYASGVSAIVQEYNAVNLAAAISTFTLLAVPASKGGQYRVSFSTKVTRAATTSSTLGGTNGFRVIYTDQDDSVVVTTGNIANGSGATLTANTTQTVYSGSFIANCKASTNLQFNFDYTSVGATTMQYNIHVRVEAI